jgi:hypothetical protein
MSLRTRDRTTATTPLAIASFCQAAAKTSVSRVLAARPLRASRRQARARVPLRECERARHEEALGKLFSSVLGLCKQAGLVKVG